MYRHNVVSGLAALALAFALLFAPPLQALEPDMSGASFRLTSASKNLLNLEKYTGKVVFLDFWASWCPSCRKSLPWLDNLQSKYRGRGLEVLAVNLDSDFDAAQRAIKELGINLAVVFDPQGTTAESYQVKSMPSSFLLGPDGQVKAAFEGFRESKQSEIEQQIVDLLPR